MLTEALRSILIQDTGDLSDAAFRRYVCDIIAAKTLAKVGRRCGMKKAKTKTLPKHLPTH